MKLYTFNPSDLNYLDTGEFTDRYFTDVANQNIDLGLDPDYKQYHDSLLTKSVNYNLALKQVKAKSESQELEALDKVRDDQFETVRGYVKLFRKTKDPIKKVAYTKINIVLKVYKGIEKINYPSETLAINKFLDEVRSANNLPHSQALGLLPYLDELDADNTAFEAKFNQRSTEVISTQTYNTKELRTEVLAAYKKMVNYVVVIADVRPAQAAFYNELITTINYSRKYFAGLRGGGTNPPTTPTA